MVGVVMIRYLPTTKTPGEFTLNPAFFNTIQNLYYGPLSIELKLHISSERLRKLADWFARIGIVKDD